MYQLAFNTGCTACSLHTYKAVAGQSNVPFDKVKLMIISSNPSKGEEESGISLCDEKGRDKSPGAYLRFVLRGAFDSDPLVPDEIKPFENYCYYTNAVKCSKRERTIQDIHRKRCRDKWLLTEIAALPPTTPILLASSDAVKAVLGKVTLNNTRGKINYYHNHPVVTTFNLADVERGMSFLVKNEESVRKDLRTLLAVKKKFNDADVDKLVKVRYWAPFPPLSIGWLFQRDINLLKELVIGKST
jgi:uracil-DNA glycosylase